MPHLVTAIIKPFKLEEVKEALRGAGLLGLTVSEVLVESSQAYKVIELIATAARTGKIGDGKVWAFEVDQLMRIRTGELGDEAV